MLRQAPQPLAKDERIQTVDIIRGFALFGVLVVNFTVDNASLEPWAGWISFADQVAYWSISVFLNDKFQTIYCFLFGLGFSLQLLRSEARKSPFLLMYLRRLAVLFVIGAIHFILVGQRDILADYAMMGLLLLILHKLPQRTLPLLALLCILVPWGYRTVTDTNREEIVSQRLNAGTGIFENYVGIYQMENGNKHIITTRNDTLFGDGPAKHYYLIPQSDTTFVRSDNPKALYTFLRDSDGGVDRIAVGVESKVFLKKISGELGQALNQQHLKQQDVKGGRALQSYDSFISANARTFWNGLRNWGWLGYFWGGEISGILPFFLMGLYAGRRKIFVEIASNRPLLIKVVKWGFLLGFTGVGISVGFSAWAYFSGSGSNMDSVGSLTRNLFKLPWDIGCILISGAYIAGLTLILEKDNWRKKLSFLSPVGRMGLTNYILHSAIITLTFDGYGLHLYGIVGPFWRLMCAILVFIFIIFLSRWWFTRFEVGPMEWLWRSLTYLKFQPMRTTPMI